MDKNEQKESEDLNLNFLDPNNLQNIIDNVKFCLDRSAKLVILQLSYDKPTHINNNLASVKFFYDYIKMVFLKYRNWNKIVYLSLLL